MVSTGFGLLLGLLACSTIFSQSPKEGPPQKPTALPYSPSQNLDSIAAGVRPDHYLAAKKLEPVFEIHINSMGTSGYPAGGSIIFIQTKGWIINYRSGNARGNRQTARVEGPATVRINRDCDTAKQPIIRRDDCLADFPEAHLAEWDLDAVSRTGGFVGAMFFHAAISTCHVGEVTSEDVIKDFFVPAFRTKQDNGLGQVCYRLVRAHQAGQGSSFFCSEYCGTKQSGMIGWVYETELQDYQTCLNFRTGSDSLTGSGEKVFAGLARGKSHKPDNSGRGPSLVCLFGNNVTTVGGGKVRADQSYIRESILNPAAKLVVGFEPVMLTFQGLVSQGGVLQLVEYVSGLGQKQGTVTKPALAR